MWWMTRLRELRSRGKEPAMNDQRRVLQAPAARRGPRPALGRLLIAAPLLGWALDVSVGRAQTAPGTASTAAVSPSYAPAAILNPQRAEAEARLRSIAPAAVLNAPKETASASPTHHFPPAAILNTSASQAAARTPASVARPTVVTRRAGTASSTPKVVARRAAAPAGVRSQTASRPTAVPSRPVATGTVRPSIAANPGRSTLDRSVKPTRGARVSDSGSALALHAPRGADAKADSPQRDGGDSAAGCPLAPGH